MGPSLPSSYKKLAQAVAVITGVGAGAATYAQEETVEEVLVTGSFISRPADRPQPVAVMDNQELVRQQRVTITEAVRDMPQVSSANTTNNWTGVTNSINLRGLGSRSTLVLINGQRMTIDANSGSLVDVNNLAPSIMIERMELVLDGASALYGSDAVAGVANFITRNNFEGAEIRVSSQHAEAQMSVPEAMIGGIFGVQGAKTGVVMSFELMNRSEAMNVRDIRSDERIALGLVTALYNPGTYLGTTKPGWYPDPLCGSPLIGGDDRNWIGNKAGALNHNSAGEAVTRDPFCRGSLTHSRSLIPEMQRFTGFSVMTHQFDTDFVNQLSVEMGFARENVVAGYGTGVPLLALPTVGGKLPKENPGVIEANRMDPSFPVQDYRTLFTRQVSPLDGDLDSTAEQHTYRLAATLDGQFGNSGWDWRANAGWSHNDQIDETVDTITYRYALAIQGYGGPNCKFNPVLGAANDPNVAAGVGNCLWWNPMANRLLAKPGDPFYNDPDLLEWMQFGPKTYGQSDLYQAEAVVTGELFEMAGGMTGIAFGAQVRKQELDIDYGPIAKDGGFGFSPEVVKSWSSTRVSKAVFAEMVMFPSETLEIDIAARFEDTEGASSTEPKISMLWTPTDSLFVRASAGSSFRLPSENQSYGVASGAVSRATIGGEVTQATGLSVGNPNLMPETSDNYTFGFTWDINDNWTVDATYWNYEFTNLVTSTDPNAVLLDDMADGFVNNPAAHPLFPGRPNEVCEITGRWAGPGSGQALPEGCMTGFDIRIFYSSFINQNSVETDGFDFSLAYSNTIAGGEFGARIAGALVNAYKGTNTQGQLQDVVGTDGFNVAGVGTNPDLRYNVIVDYAKDNHYIRGTYRYTAGTEVTDPNPLVKGRTSEDDYDQIDVTYTYTLPWAGNSSASLAILNITDNEPPVVANGLVTSNTSLYDARGRMWRASLNWSF
jgi:iron complex outermembrane receptor protein